MRKKYWRIWAAGILFATAWVVMLYPLLSAAYNQRHQSVIHTQYEQELTRQDQQVLVECRARAESYNEALASGVQRGDAFSSAAVEAAKEHYGNLLDVAGDGIMGYLVIPKIQVQLPIYHGTADATLEVGVGHLLGSSLPVGGSSTHAVLTGHSGMANNKMLSDLDQLQIGDAFYLEILGQILAYQVDQIRTVLPTDTKELKIAKGEDRCTLVTCTPFGINTHRLLVRGRRSSFQQESVAEGVANKLEKAPSTWEQQYILGILAGVVIAGILCAFFLLATFLRKGRGGRYER